MGDEGSGPEGGERGTAADGCGDLVVIGEVTLPGVRRSVGYARGFVRELLPDHPGLDDLVTVTSEAVANAVRHTASGLEGGRVSVVLAVGPGVYRLEVRDDGAAVGRPHVKAEVGAETGRGMRIVDGLASRWGYRVDGSRTVVWAEFPAPAAEERGRGRERGPDGGAGPVSGPG
ncbi:ATP-binding protein [Actinomadura rubrisoli]|uniref:ATP-binding protein n=1 Tax=Actinomadura rubrisoli TaxID=2530368 RepID=UPI0014044F79|nr:ATP-binding protein [Actinomadura rubrisoli]